MDKKLKKLLATLNEKQTHGLGSNVQIKIPKAVIFADGKKIVLNDDAEKEEA